MRTDSPVPARVHIAGRSLHRWLIPLPILAFVLTVFGFGMHGSDGGVDWLRFAFISNLALFGAAIAAAIPGLLDFSSIAPEHPARRVGWVHFGLNGVALALALLNVLLHPRQITAVLDGRHFALEAFDSTPSLWLTGVGLAVASLAAMVGRLLATRHRVGEVRVGDDSRIVPVRPRTI